MTGSFTIARLARLDERSATAISLELGLHNATIAIAVGASIATVLTIPAAVYSGFMFITAGLFARLMFVRNGGRTVSRSQTARPAPVTLRP
jgi:BASS family bile acid:Na+ symporter